MATPAVRVSSAADELAQQLAARSRNSRLCPAALWFPEAQSVLAASQRSSADRGPPSAAPPLWQNTGPGRVTASSGVVQSRTATRPPSLPRGSTSAQRTIDAFHFSTRDEDESSSDMDDDALVASYITPPISPTASPGSTHPGSARRHCYSATRASRAAAAAKTPASQVQHELDVTTTRDIHHVVRNSFSSACLELMRTRAELIVVKSQSASTLRRTDGVAAASKGSGSRDGVVVERLTLLHSALADLGDRLSTARTGDGDAGPADTNSTTIIRDINVCSLLVRVSGDGSIRAVGYDPLPASDTPRHTVGCHGSGLSLNRCCCLRR